MKHLLKTLLLLNSVYVIIALASCKKESHQQSGNIQFDLNGIHHSFSIDGNLYHIVDSANNSIKEVVMRSSQNSIPYAAIQFCDLHSDQNSGYISGGSYSDSICSACNFFLFQYDDNTIGALGSADINDITFANITSTTNGTPVINGTFDCWLSDPSGTVNLHLTNGKVINCGY